MPYAAKRPCTVCGKLGQCPQHRASVYREQQRKQQGRPREKTAARGYGARWRATKAGYLAHHPYCVICAKAGVVEPATVVDHIVPHRGDRELFWDHDNWQSLCARCHSIKTANDESFRGPDGRWGSAKDRP